MNERTYTATCSCGWTASSATRPGALVLAEHHELHTTRLGGQHHAVTVAVTR